ncbi:hypothetical protein [Ferruginibacter sp. SUN106]|uniref:hypothetical protein n=1 Tax=Ferruginibacter sp. SUN106 TaxID=2978348 RepID=UPI003D368AD3
MKLKGKWIGQYTYGEMYPENYIGKSVSFEMNLTANGIQFYGNFSDDETRNIFQDNGIVGGFLEGDYICFDKQYPKAWKTNEAGVIEILENSIAPLIKYEGVLSNNQFEGAWEIHQYYKEDDQIFSVVLGVGTWDMRKSTSQ